MKIRVNIFESSLGAPASRRQVSRAILSLIFFLLLTIASPAADSSAGFDSANQLYEQGKFSEAAAAYQQVIQSGKVSPALYFNLGNALFKSGQLGRAIAAYRDAEKISPRDPDVRANLQFIRGRVQNSTVSVSRWQQWLATLTINEWALLTAAVFWAWIAMLIAIQFRPALKQSLRTLIWCGGIATFAFCGCLGATWSSGSNKTAIVIQKDVVLHNGPLDESPSSATVHDGAELSVLDTKNDWLQVRADSQRVGWLKRDQVVLEPGS
jgi:tetratricopeptide (TPR) repeat protein